MHGILGPRTMRLCGEAGPLIHKAKKLHNQQLTFPVLWCRLPLAETIKRGRRRGLWPMVRGVLHATGNHPFGR